ncbi:MAG: hypothetical protein IR153_05025 [Flavobacterium sp.]|nr:hypothetical protein [Flavobacterium sp.]MBF6608489.1 hypothetical protein [Flavobacterium sp.]
MFTNDKNQATEKEEALGGSGAGYGQNSETDQQDENQHSAVSDDELLGYLWERSFL